MTKVHGPGASAKFATSGVQTGTHCASQPANIYISIFLYMLTPVKYFVLEYNVIKAVNLNFLYSLFFSICWICLLQGIHDFKQAMR